VLNFKKTEQRTARFLLVGACDSYVSCVHCVHCCVLSCLRWLRWKRRFTHEFEAQWNSL